MKKIYICCKVFVLRNEGLVPGYVTSIQVNSKNNITVLVQYKDSDIRGDFRVELFDINDCYSSLEEAREKLKIIDEWVEGDIMLKPVDWKINIGDTLNLKFTDIYMNYKVIGMTLMDTIYQNVSIALKSENGKIVHLLLKDIEQYK